MSNPSYYQSAIEAAELRLHGAEKWKDASAALLESAQAQVASSRREFRAAKKYLQTLKVEGGNGATDGVCATSNLKHMPSMSDDETESETISCSSTGKTMSPSNSVATCPPTMQVLHEANDEISESVDAAKDAIKRKVKRLSVENREEDSSSVVSKPDDVSISSDRAGCTAVELAECGLSEINGKYHQFESSDGVPAYSKIDSYKGKEAIFTIGRWKSDSGLKKWCITATVPDGSSPKRYAFYVAYAPGFMLKPPKKNWMVVEGSEHFLYPEYEGGMGVNPGPMITHESDDAQAGGKRKTRLARPMFTRQRSMSAPRAAGKPRSTSFIQPAPARKSREKTRLGGSVM